MMLTRKIELLGKNLTQSQFINPSFKRPKFLENIKYKVVFQIVSFASNDWMYVQEVMTEVQISVNFARGSRNYFVRFIILHVPRYRSIARRYRNVIVRWNLQNILDWIIGSTVSEQCPLKDCFEYSIMFNGTIHSLYGEKHL